MESESRLFEVEYYAGTYEGKRVVRAADADSARESVKRWVRRQMTLPMYSDGYKVREIQADA